MKLKTTFSESDQGFLLQFGEVHNVSDGGYERGYAAGYETGNTEGYDKGHTEGVAEGYAEGVASVPDYLEQLMADTLVEYRNEKVTAIKAHLFSGNTKIETVNFPSVTSIGERAFYNCSSLAEVDISLAQSIGQYCFQGTKIVEAIFPNVTSLGACVFFSCGTITTALFPKSLNVGNSMFRGCSKLKTIDFSSAETIETTAFYMNTSLEYADFPRVKSIGTTAFIACKNLKTLLLRNTDGVCSLANINALDQTPIESGTGYIYVPKNLVEQYKAATNWSTYADQFRALEDYTVDGTTTGELDESKI